MVELTRAEAAAVAQMIEFNIFDSIRNDPGIDNLQWLVAMVHAWEKLDAASREPEPEPEEPKEADSGSMSEDKTTDGSKRRGRKSVALTQEQKLKVVGLRRKGVALKEIARAVGASVSAVKAFNAESAWAPVDVEETEEAEADERDV